MKILIISKDYFPDETGIAATSTNIAEGLAERGHNVTVVSSLPFYPEWKIKEDYRKKKKQKVNNVQIFRTYIYIPQKMNPLKRLMHELSYNFLSLIKCIFFERPDVIFVVSPPLFSGIVGIILSYRFNAPVFLQIQDLVPDAAVELGILRNKKIIKLLSLIEIFIYNNVKCISAIGPGNAESYIRQRTRS